MSTSREDRARLRAARVEIDGRLVAVNARVHGTRSVADAHGCQCDPCRKVEAKRSHHQRQSRKGREGVAAVELKKCGRAGCRKRVPFLAGDTPARYRRRDYHDDVCRNIVRVGKAVAARRARAPWVGEVRLCLRGGCGVRFTPTNERQRYHDHPCSVLARGDNRRVDTKVCACPCRQVFERPPDRCGTFWEGRRYIDIEHRKRAGYNGKPEPKTRSPLANGAPGAARAGRRKEPAPRLSKARRVAEAKPAETRPVFAGPAPVTPWRPPMPVVERVVRVAPRPSFGLSRRSA